LLASATAGAIIAASGIPAAAQGLFSPGAYSWYVKGFGGATFMQDQDADLYSGGTRIVGGDIDFDTGWTLGGAVGADLTDNFALELEYAHRRADVSSFRLDGFRIDADDSRSDSIMLNALYSMDGMGANGAWRPYVGGGVGTTSLTLNAGGDDLERNWILAYQLIGGVAYDITPNWSLNGEVRWFAAEGGRYSAPGNSSLRADYQTIDLLVGATYRF
jgi:opacity protein-like surface antigen